ncbi:sperm-associated antigen 17 isoform X2 [Sardina pilchardus]|uniref:sperm-associated antigen 17 isoform X2 n=1 Tax=Sardina pilchardus TaxID=27697 RepID=UPI002E150285
MPPKRQKSGITAAGVSPSVVWENGLTAATLEEEFWKLSISWVVVECLEDMRNLSALALAVQQPLRRQFSIISWDTTLHKINELGNAKVKKVKDIPPFHEVMEVAKSTLDAGEEISTELMAKLLKFQLLCMKTADLQRLTEQKAAEEKSKAKSSPTKEGGKTANKAEKGKKNPEAGACVKDTKLRRRGEEDDSQKYIDDEPEDGPQLYVLLLGFNQTMLLSALDSIGVHVSNIIRLSSQNREYCDGATLSSSGAEEGQTVMQKELNNFWTHLEEVFLSGCNQSRLFDVVCLNCILENNLCPDQDNVEAMLDCGAQVFEAVASLIYDCLDWRQEHLHYLSSMNIIDVPSISSGQTQRSPESSAEGQLSANPTSVSKKKHSEDSPDFQAEALNTYVDMRLYCDLLKQIPPECVSVPLILHCMLDQVVMSEQGGPTECATSIEPEQSDCNFTNHVISAAANLPCSSKEKKRLMENFGKLEDINTRSPPMAPLLMSYHDKRAERLHKCPVLNDFNVTNIEADMMKNGPVWNLLHSKFNQDRRMGGIIQNQELIRLFSDGLMNIDDSSELLKKTLHSLSDWNVLEYFNAPVFSQVLQEASQTYHCMDTYRISKDGSLLIFCHNPISSQRDSRQSWDVALHTDVGFRDYLEHVASSLSGWNMEINRSPDAGVLPQSCAASPATSEERPQTYIQEESLKAMKLEQERLKKEEQEKKVQKEKTGKTAGKGNNRSDSAKDNKKSLSSQSQEELLHSVQSTSSHLGKESDNQDTSETQTAFTGYSMNGCLIHLTSEMHCLYPADGGVIEVDRYHFIHGLPQMKICVMKDKHQFFIYYSGSDRGIQTELSMQGRHSDHHGSFFAVLSSGMKLSFNHPSTGRQEQERTLLTEMPSVVPSNHCSQSQSAMADDTAVPLDSTLPQGLHVCTPDGVTVHFICQETSDGGKKVLVRQSSIHLHPSHDGSDCTNTEISRVITTEGTVIRYFRDGSSEILFADGTVSRCQDSENVLHSTQDPFTTESDCLKEQSVDGREFKEKKGKGNLEMGVGNDVDEQKKQNDQGPAELCKSWTTPPPSGLSTSGDASGDIQPILTYTSTDPFSQTVVIVREDGVITVQEIDGSKVIEHADGTRITTFYQEAKEVNEDMPGRIRRWVMVKQTGFPTVLMGDDGGCHVLFGDRTAVIANSSGSYQIMPFGSGVFSINEEGQAIYTSQQRSPTAEPLKPSSYMMSTSGDILCEMTDSAGNQFQVKADGQTSMTAGTVTENNMKDCLKTTHIPRLFVAHSDGSGLELLSSQALEELLLEAYANPAMAVLKEVAPEFTGAQEITLLMPSYMYMDLDQKQKENIFSTHLKCRNWDRFPSDEKKSIGPSFGTSLSSIEHPWAVSPASHPMLSCPEVLLVRQLIHIPLESMQEHTRLLPRSLEDRLPEYAMKYSKQLMSSERLCQDIQLLEFRSSDEQEAASNLLQLLLIIMQWGQALKPLKKKYP